MDGGVDGVVDGGVDGGVDGCVDGGVDGGVGGGGRVSRLAVDAAAAAASGQAVSPIVLAKRRVAREVALPVSEIVVAAIGRAVVWAVGHVEPEWSARSFRRASGVDAASLPKGRVHGDAPEGASRKRVASSMSVAGVEVEMWRESR